MGFFGLLRREIESSAKEGDVVTFDCSLWRGCIAYVSELSTAAVSALSYRLRLEERFRRQRRPGRLLCPRRCRASDRSRSGAADCA